MISTVPIANNLARLAGLSVLVADDDPLIRDLWKHMLSKTIPNVLTAEARDGMEAVRLARELEPDLVIMDVAMPQLDGFGATRELKAHSGTARIPVLAVTGSVFSSHEALSAGCDGYLLKPISEEQLLREVVRLLGAYVR